MIVMTILLHHASQIKGEIVVGERRDGNGEMTRKTQLPGSKGYGFVIYAQNGGKEFTPTELSAAVLKKIKSDVEDKVGKIEEAVITIPQTSLKRPEMPDGSRSTCRIKCKYIINEPTAAALYYAYQSMEIYLEHMWFLTWVEGHSMFLSSRLRTRCGGCGIEWTSQIRWR